MTPEQIKEFRTKLGLSQEAMAHLIGISFATLNRWEKGVTKPRNLAIMRIKDLMKSQGRKSA